MSPIYEYAAGLWREMRDEFELQVEAAHAAAEEGTHGKMLNARGRREGIDAYSLMTGPWSRVRLYGSPELIEWCETEGRPSVARFEREWFAAWLGEEPLPDDEELIPVGTCVRLRHFAGMLGIWPGGETGAVVAQAVPGAGLRTLYDIDLDNGAKVESVAPDSFVILQERHAADC